MAERPKPTLMLIDGHSLAYRAYHALPLDMSNRDGEPTNAAFGFAAMLLQVLEAYQPDHVAVAFDRGYSDRDQLYPEYKANRIEMAEGMRAQMGWIRGIVESLGIPVYEEEGWEADDILGTLCEQANRADLQTLIVTGDTDAFQLIDENTRVVTSGRRFSDAVIYDEAAVRDRYGIAPRDLVQWKGLSGDPSDNIPGVPGVGAKTATNLIQTYGTVEEAIAHASELRSRKLGERLVAYAGQARLGVELVTIRRDAPVELDLASSLFRTYDRQRVMRVFRELDFHSLVDRLPAMGLDEESNEIRRPDGRYETVASYHALVALVSHLRDARRIAVDVETTSTDAMRARLVGIALADTPGRGWYVPVERATDPAPAARQGTLDLSAAEQARHLALDRVAEALAPVLTGTALKVAHHAKYDLLVLRRHGIEVSGPFFDTLVAAWLIDPGSRKLGLKALAWSILEIEMTAISDLIGKGRSQITMDQVPVAEVAAYAGADVDMTLRLVDHLDPLLTEREARRLYDEVEMPLVPVLMDMEEAGILVDRDILSAISDELAERILDLETDVYKAAGHAFNIGSPQQLGKVLFEELGLPPAERTSTGYSTAASVLAGLAPGVPIVQDVLQWRHLTKLKGTYVDALPALINPETGRVHTSWSQTSVVTGRLSSSEPNLQNIPVRSELGGQIRRAFVAPTGRVLLAADYSQMELRIVAALSGDAALREVFRTGGDVHAATAAFLFDKDPLAVTANERRIAKTVNFGILYGMGAFGLAQRTGLSRGEASDFIERYFAQYEGVRAYFDGVLAHAAEKGHVDTILGRRRYFPELQGRASGDPNVRRRAEREAINAPIQGSAADITKVAMINLHRAMAEHGLSGRLLLQVHDELLLEVPQEELDEVAALTRRVMSDAVSLSVALTVDLSAGPNWGELVPFEPERGRSR